MIGNDRFIDQLEDYLDAFDGVTPLPDRVREAVHAAVPDTRQVRDWPGPLRSLTPASRILDPARWGVVAAAIVLTVVASTLILGNRAPGVATMASPGTTPELTLAPSRSAAVGEPLSPGTPLDKAGYGGCGRGGRPISCIVPGIYALPSHVVRANVTLAVPYGWFEWDPGPGLEGLLVDRGLDAAGGSGWGVVFASVGIVSRDPCDSSAGTFPVVQTSSVDGLTAAMASWPGFEAGEPRPIKIGGAQGRVIALTSSETAATCPLAVMWKTPQGTALDGYPLPVSKGGPYTAQYYVLDVGEELLVIRTTDFPQPSPFEVQQGLPPEPERHRSDQQTLHAILDSIEITEAP
jgi:hypothetical protein